MRVGKSVTVCSALGALDRSCGSLVFVSCSAKWGEVGEVSGVGEMGELGGVGEVGKVGGTGCLLGLDVCKTEIVAVGASVVRDSQDCVGCSVGSCASNLVGCSLGG